MYYHDDFSFVVCTCAACDVEQLGARAEQVQHAARGRGGDLGHLVILATGRRAYQGGPAQPPPEERP